MDDMNPLQSFPVESNGLSCVLNKEVFDVYGYVEDTEDQIPDVVLDSDDEFREKNCTTTLEPIKRHHSGGSFRGADSIDKQSEDTCHDFMNYVASSSPNHKLFPVDSQEFQHTDKDSPPIVRLTSDESKSHLEVDRNANIVSSDCNDIGSQDFIASQVKALDFVDCYISGGDFGLDKDEAIRKSVKIKSPPSLRSKGTQTIARRISMPFDANMSLTFEWSDKQIEHHDHNVLMIRSSKIGLERGKLGDLSVRLRDENQMELCNEKLVAYDSLEMDENIDVDSSREMVNKGHDSGLAACSFGIGMDTQIAVEAMESLRYSTPSISHASLSDSDAVILNLSSASNFKKAMFSEPTIVGWGRKGKRSDSVKISSKELKGQRVQIVKVSAESHVKVYNRRLKRTVHSDQEMCSELSNCSYKDEATEMKSWTTPKSSSHNSKEQLPLRNKLIVYTRKRKSLLKLSSGTHQTFSPENNTEQNYRSKRGCEVSSSRSYFPSDRSPMMKELMRLGYSDIPSFLPRKRASIEKVCILFSNHMGMSLLKRQKKIVSRLGLSTASCCTDATHFVVNKFLRTRNMLEAVALGKPVVTHLWLEACDQAGYIIDVRNYILRDTKKEMEIGFTLPVSIERAKLNPLLKDKSVLITPNAKPSTNVIQVLVSAAQGQIIQSLEDSINLESILIISSEEDYSICRKFIEKGAAIYSSELLFIGILTQKLEYERYQLFRQEQEYERISYTNSLSTNNSLS